MDRILNMPPSCMPAVMTEATNGTAKILFFGFKTRLLFLKLKFWIKTRLMTLKNQVSENKSRVLPPKTEV